MWVLPQERALGPAGAGGGGMLGAPGGQGWIRGEAEAQLSGGKAFCSESFGGGITCWKPEDPLVLRGLSLGLHNLYGYLLNQKLEFLLPARYD